MEILVRLFRRETSSTAFIPEIDGLRFLAIAMVVLCHVSQMIAESATSLQIDYQPILSDLVPNVFLFGYQGVQLFFVISGFVLAIPFMRYYFGISDRKVSLKKYFLRRLTRLEPPYILSLTIFFLLALYVGRDTVERLVVSLFSSLLYIHNFVFPGVAPFINGVTWSLEIEVQYYILAPLIVWAICCIKGRSRRRIVTLALIIVFSAISWLLEVFLEVKTVSLATYLQYFLCGILLCDLYLLETRDTKYLDSIFVFIAGLVLLTLIVGTEHAKSVNILLRIASPLMILGFYCTIFWNTWWRKFFSLNALTLIGGMCYTIYLLHYTVVSAVARRTAGLLQIADYRLFFIVQAAIILFVVLLVSSTYFLMIEKPCMKKDWPQKLYAWLKLGPFFGKASLKDS
jgi:peptidoglycan/LPS O-acetylase OafA/YrhL